MLMRCHLRPLHWLLVAEVGTRVVDAGSLVIRAGRALERVGERLIDVAEPRLPDLVRLEALLREAAVGGRTTPEQDLLGFIELANYEDAFAERDRMASGTHTDHHNGSGTA